MDPVFPICVPYRPCLHRAGHRQLQHKHFGFWITAEAWSDIVLFAPAVFLVLLKELSNTRRTCEDEVRSAEYDWEGKEALWGKI